MLNVPAEENRIEQLPHIEVAAKERTMKLSYYKDFHGDPHAAKSRYKLAVNDSNAAGVKDSSSKIILAARASSKLYPVRLTASRHSCQWSLSG
jgi:hypothetical protein